MLLSICIGSGISITRIGISIEPSLIEHIKSVFRIDPLPVYGFHAGICNYDYCVLLYQLMVYYNCKEG